MDGKVEDPGRIYVFTGAGISAESGVPTFTGSGGLWDGTSIEEVCSEASWRVNFEKVHRFYNGMRSRLADVQPNAAHTAVAAWQRTYGAVIMTQNVDDLHERAGATDVIHLHGRLTGMRCVACGGSWDIGYSEWPSDGRCRSGRRRCDSLKGVRPDVVFYGGRAKEYAHLHRALNHLREVDTVVVIGTSGQTLPFPLFLRHKTATRIFNARSTPPAIPEAFDHVILEPATSATGKISEILTRRHAPLRSPVSGERLQSP